MKITNDNAKLSQFLQKLEDDKTFQKLDPSLKINKSFDDTLKDLLK